MTVESAIIAGFGFLIALLLGVIGYFLIRLVLKIDQNSDKLTEYGLDLKDIANSVRTVQGRVSDFAREIDQRIHEQNAEIHLLRSRTHTLFGYLTALRMQAQLRGWDFKSDDWNLSSSDRPG